MKQVQGLDEWLSWLETAHSKPIDFGLERIQIVFQRLFPNGVPFKVISVAGTNGKGSTVAALEAIYSNSGVNIGCYTSPHIEDFNERIRINATNVSDACITEAFDELLICCQDVSLTYFEFAFLSALMIFKKQSVSLAVLEVGLGGRLDAVNVVDADLAIITNVDLDHTEYLGNSREAIAKEKAGILREGIPLVIGDLNPPQSLLEQSTEKNCKTYQQALNFGYTEDSSALGTWSWFCKSQKMSNLPYPRIRLQNAATALMAVEAFEAFFPVNENTIREALKRLTIRGRQEVWSLEPEIILDVAHNPQATEALASRLRLYPEKKTYAVFGVCEDKDIAATISPLLPIISEWHLVPLPVSRGANPHVVSNTLCELKKKSNIYQSVEAGMYGALEMLQPNERLIVFGSFYLLGPAYRMLRNTEKAADLL